MLRSEIEFDEDKDLVRFTLYGPVTIEDFIRLGDAHFMEHATSRSIWDLREADLSGIVVTDMPVLTASSRSASQHRKNPKSALIVDDEGKRALLKLYSVVAEAGKSTIEYRIFPDLEEALAWIDDGRDSQHAGLSA